MSRFASMTALLLLATAASAGAKQLTALTASTSTLQTTMNKVVGGDTVKLVGDFGRMGLSMVNNRVDGLFPHAIACYLCSSSTFTGNVLASLNGAEYQVRVNIINGANNVLRDNIIGRINQAAARRTVYRDRDKLIGGSVHAPTFSSAGGVPGPREWTLLIAGFAAVGLPQRRQLRRSVAA